MEKQLWSLYRVTNKLNGKIYIGQAADISKRWSDHRKAVRLNRPTQIVHHAMIKHGLDNFVFEVIASCQTQENANDVETILVKQYDSFVGNGKGYNATLGGMNAPKTEEWKHKVSEKLMGHEVSQETRDKVSQCNTGKIRSEEFKKNVGDSGEAKNEPKSIDEICRESLKGKAPLVSSKKGKTWKIIDGKRVWVEKGGNIL